MLTWGRYYWPIFLTISSLWILTGFGIAELIAIFTDGAHKDNTLSFYARTELHVSSVMTVHTLAWWASLLTFVVVGFILLLHIWFDLLG